MKTLTKEEIKNIEKALTHHANYSMDLGGKPVSLKGVPMLPLSPNSSSNYLRVMDFVSMHNSGSKSQKLSLTLKQYFSIVGVSSLNEALQRLKDIEIKKGAIC